MLDRHGVGTSINLRWEAGIRGVSLLQAKALTNVACYWSTHPTGAIISTGTGLILKARYQGLEQIST